VVTRGDSPRSRIQDGIWFHTAKPDAVDSAICGPQICPASTKNLAYSNGVRKKIQDLHTRFGLDIVESPNWDVEGLLTAMEHRIPVVVRAHSPMFKVMETQALEWSEDLRLCSALEGILLKHADAVSGSTKALLDLVDGAFAIGQKKALIRLGIAASNRCARVGERQEARILFVGRLERRKGIHTLLEAIPMVLASFPDARFQIAGRDSSAAGGKRWREIWSEQAAPGISRAVSFLGEVDQQELERLYESCDIFVAPSLYESFGIVYLEAMAHAKPVVGCRTGGVPEVVADGETGILVTPDDAYALANAILDLLKDERLRKSLGEAGHERYRLHFSREAMAGSTLEFYEAVIQRWREGRRIIWQADALHLQREAACLLQWSPESGYGVLLAEAGEPRTVVYGPYIAIGPGLYRAEFHLWSGPVAPKQRIAKIDVFSMKDGAAAERECYSEDCAAGMGCIFDLFFSVAEPGGEDYEFRVHTTGSTALFIKAIAVTAWQSENLTNAAGND
jgi:glycosyltransferase involved in cell wall biosynthesis